MTRKYLPISIDITNEKILVLGGDKSAASKISILQGFGAEVEVVSRKIITELKALSVEVKLKNYEANDLNGYLMVYSCLNNHELDKQIVAVASSGQNVHNSIKLRDHLQTYLKETIEKIITI
jgi:siroheme synthase-like protein